LREVQFSITVVLLTIALKVTNSSYLKLSKVKMGSNPIVEIDAIFLFVLESVF
jgi:hypothetical protein